MHCFCDTARYWSKVADFNLPNASVFGTSVGMTLLEFRKDIKHPKTIPGLSYGTAMFA